MQLVLHTGAHFTEEERLVKCLLRNQDIFSERGVIAPGPGRYRKLLRDTVVAMKNAQPTPDARDTLLDVILDDAEADRVLLSVKYLFGVPRAVVHRGQLYPRAAERLANFATIFAQDEIELFMAIRNPATFLPACLKKSPHPSISSFLRGVDPRDIRWSDMFEDMRAAAPEIPITVWCNEDAPLLWTQIIREMAGLDHEDHIVGGFDLMSEIMERDGMVRFVSYLKSQPKMNEMQLRRAMAAFMERFALEDAVEQEIDVPEWTSELVDEITEGYDEDVMDLARIPGVTLITP